MSVDIPESQTGQWQLWYWHADHGQCSEYVGEDEVQARAEQLDKDDEVYELDVAPRPVPQLNGTPPLDELDSV
jgi:hypothetical protein